ncbi:MAG: hypothetical protein AB1656_27455 [Candidatus Omnitrophota bacterium]
MKPKIAAVWILSFLFLSPACKTAISQPALHVVDFSKIPFTEMMENGNLETIKNGRLTVVRLYSQGFLVREKEGRDGSTAAYCENGDGSRSLGLTWSFTLSQTQPEPVRFTGWSRAQDVEGSRDSNYSLYIDIIYQDGTPSWGHNVPFNAGTHEWEQQTLLVVPEKPIKTISCYALFRGRKGRVWFDDFSFAAAKTPEGMFKFNGLSARLGASATEPFQGKEIAGENLKINIDPTSAAVSNLEIGNRKAPLADGPSGLLARDAAQGSDYFSFRNGRCDALNLELDLDIQGGEKAILLQGKIRDLTRSPRAISLIFVLPIDAAAWQWGDHLTGSRPVNSRDEFSDVANIGTGTDGTISRYPFAPLYNENMGLGLGIDMGKPCQWRLGYSGGGRLFYIAFDLGLHPATKNFPSEAPFAFVLYGFDPAWGFRAAADKYYQIFPDHFVARSRDQGIWMPFTDVSTVQGWSDFGFKYHEGTNNISFDDKNGILSFRYSEPSTWWMSMPKETPRTYDAAMAMVRQYAESSQSSNNRTMARALLNSGSYDENGKFQVQFRDEPWCDGAVFSLNPNPYLPGDATEASTMWNEDIAERLYGAGAKGVQDGEYLDSLEGYVTADLDYREDHFAAVTAPLTFTMDSRRPVIYKAFLQYEFTRYISDEMHRRGKLLFANSVPSRYTFLCPWLDVMGTETNWIQNGQFAPESAETMNYRRTLCAKKPYLFLMNTDFSKMTMEIVEKYFQRCLFWGMYPSMFSHNAANDPYWQNPTLYNRDRPLFQKYQPLIKQAAEAGWEPVTLARSDRDAIRVERFGPDSEGAVYLTVMNEDAAARDFSIAGEAKLAAKGKWKEMLSGQEGDWEKGLTSRIESKSTQLYRIVFKTETSSIQEMNIR